MDDVPCPPTDRILLDAEEKVHKTSNKQHLTNNTLGYTVYIIPSDVNRKTLLLLQTGSLQTRNLPNSSGKRFS